MPLTEKINVLQALKNKGYNTTLLRKEKILSESTTQKFRKNKGVSWDNIETICRLLECQPGDILEFIPDEK